MDINTQFTTSKQENQIPALPTHSALNRIQSALTPTTPQITPNSPLAHSHVNADFAQAIPSDDMSINSILTICSDDMPIDDMLLTDIQIDDMLLTDIQIDETSTHGLLQTTTPATTPAENVFLDKLLAYQYDISLVRDAPEGTVLGYLDLESLKTFRSLSQECRTLAAKTIQTRQLKIKVPSAQALEEAIVTFPKMQSLVINQAMRIAIRDDIAANLSTLDQLQSLHLKNCHISTRGIQALAASTKIQSLHIQDFEYIEDEAIEVLSRNTTLKELGLTEGDISIEGIQALATHSKVQSLDLSKMGIYLDYSEETVRALAQNTTIQSLNLSFNNFKDSDIIFLVQNNTTIQSIDLTENDENITHAGIEEIRAIRKIEII